MCEKPVTVPFCVSEGDFKGLGGGGSDSFMQSQILWLITVEVKNCTNGAVKVDIACSRSAVADK